MLELRCRALAADGIDEDMLNTWDVERDGRWIYGTYFSGYILNGQGEGDDECFVVTGSWCPVKPETVGLYTGLKDMNGKEIFEGDIVQLKWTPISYKPAEPKDWKAIVVFGNPNGLYNWGWQLTPISEAEVNHDILLWVDTEETGATCEVIGNIHEVAK